MQFNNSTQQSSASNIIPIRVLLCSYKCFNEQGIGYYGVAFA